MRVPPFAPWLRRATVLVHRDVQETTIDTTSSTHQRHKYETLPRRGGARISGPSGKLTGGADGHRQGWNLERPWSPGTSDPQTRRAQRHRARAIRTSHTRSDGRRASG